MVKTLILDPIWCPSPPPKNFFHEFCLKQLLDNVPSYHPMQFKETNFGLVWPKFGPNFFFMGVSSNRCYTLLPAFTVWNFTEN